MCSLRGRVIRGRLIVDEATDLSEGTEVELAVIGTDGQAVHEALDQALEELRAGDEGTDARAFIAELRATRR